MKITLLALCDYAEISKTGKLSLGGIKHKIAVEKVPNIKPEVYFGAVAAGSAKDVVSLKMVITDPQKKKILDKEINFDIGENGKSNLVLKITNLEISSKGKHAFALFDKRKKLAEVDFDIVLAKKAKKMTNHLPN